MLNHVPANFEVTVTLLTRFNRHCHKIKNQIEIFR